jgi:hypothetical protein
MSLKAFHIAFITISTLLAVGFGIWELKGYATSDDVLQLTAGIVSLLAAAGLVVYGVRFMRKLKHVSMI